MGNKVSSLAENNKNIDLKCCNCLKNMCFQEISESPMHMMEYKIDERGKWNVICVEYFLNYKNTNNIMQ